MFLTAQNHARAILDLVAHSEAAVRQVAELQRELSQCRAQLEDARRLLTQMAPIARPSSWWSSTSLPPDEETLHKQVFSLYITADREKWTFDRVVAQLRLLFGYDFSGLSAKESLQRVLSRVSSQSNAPLDLSNSAATRIVNTNVPALSTNNPSSSLSPSSCPTAGGNSFSRIPGVRQNAVLLRPFTDRRSGNISALQNFISALRARVAIQLEGHGQEHHVDLTHSFVVNICLTVTWLQSFPCAASGTIVASKYEITCLWSPRLVRTR